MSNRVEAQTQQLDMSVIICAYTNARWNNLMAAVESLRNQTVSPHEIIVVVDHNPGLLAQVQAYLPDVLAVENRGPRGLSATRNSGIVAAQGAVIVFLDDDAVAAPDWLERLAAVYRDPQVWGVGGKIEPIWLAGRPAWFPQEFYWVVGCTYRGLPRQRTPVRNFIGANMSFRRDVFRIIGGFRSDIGRIGALPVGCEETELCIRARQARPRQVLLYEPEARVQHNVPEDRGRWSYFRSRCYAEGRSKAMVSRFVGAKDGLAAERRHTFRTLPNGVLRGVADAVLRGDGAGLARAGAIIAGLAITTTGYVVGLTSLWWARRQLQRPNPTLTWEDSL